MIRWKTKALFLSMFLGMPLLVSAAEVELFQGGAPCHACAEACPCAPVCKRCVPVPDVMKVTKPVYAGKELDFCLPKRPLCDLFSRHCGPCGQCGTCGGCPTTTCPQCECRARVKMVLLKKYVTEEIPAFKCEPVCMPGRGCAAFPWDEAIERRDELDKVPEDQPGKLTPRQSPSAARPHPSPR